MLREQAEWLICVRAVGWRPDGLLLPIGAVERRRPLYVNDPHRLPPLRAPMVFAPCRSLVQTFSATPLPLNTPLYGAMGGDPAHQIPAAGIEVHQVEQVLQQLGMEPFDLVVFRIFQDDFVPWSVIFTPFFSKPLASRVPVHAP